MQTRSGLSSVNQDLNNQSLKSFVCVNPTNKFLDASMNQVSTVTVQQVGDMAFYKPRSTRWVDSRLSLSRPRPRFAPNESSPSAPMSSAPSSPDWPAKVVKEAWRSGATS